MIGLLLGLFLCPFLSLHAAFAERAAMDFAPFRSLVAFTHPHPS
jgi:hypothetical protein